MKKKILISGDLKDAVTYCTAIYETESDVDLKQIQKLISESPIFEDRNFYTNVLGTVQKTTVSRNSKIFLDENRITLQISYEILKVVDIEITDKDEQWINSDIKKLLEHFELLLNPFD